MDILWILKSSLGATLLVPPSKVMGVQGCQYQTLPVDD